jgi:hypothetical protein
MLLLGERNFAAAALLNHWAATGADLLVRCKSGRNLPPVARCRDGSSLARLGALTVRVIDAEISVRTAVGTRTGHYRLLTTLIDPGCHPAAELLRLHHERWETAYAELKSTILGGRVLRAHTPDGVEQEVWALLTLYQALLQLELQYARFGPGANSGFPMGTSPTPRGVGGDPSPGGRSGGYTWLLSVRCGDSSARSWWTCCWRR